MLYLLSKMCPCSSAGTAVYACFELQCSLAGTIPMPPLVSMLHTFRPVSVCAFIAAYHITNDAETDAVCCNGNSAVLQVGAKASNLSVTAPCTGKG